MLRIEAGYWLTAPSVAILANPPCSSSPTPTKIYAAVGPMNDVRFLPQLPQQFYRVCLSSQFSRIYCRLDLRKVYTSSLYPLRHSDANGMQA